MRICDEYLNRHKIDDVPVIYYPEKGALLFRLKNSIKPTNSKEIKPNWCLLDFYWETKSGQGYYHFNWEYPNYNGYIKGKLFTLAAYQKKTYCDYEDYIWEIANSPMNSICDKNSISRWSVVKGSYKEIVLSAWEMFVFQYDLFFAQQNNKIKNLLYETVDSERSYSQRYESYQNMLNFLDQNFSGVLKAWKFGVLVRISKYSDWFADLTFQNSNKFYLTHTHES